MANSKSSRTFGLGLFTIFVVFSSVASQQVPQDTKPGSPDDIEQVTSELAALMATFAEEFIANGLSFPDNMVRPETPLLEQFFPEVMRLLPATEREALGPFSRPRRQTLQPRPFIEVATDVAKKTFCAQFTPVGLPSPDAGLTRLVEAFRTGRRRRQVPNTGLFPAIGGIVQAAIQQFQAGQLNTVVDPARVVPPFIQTFCGAQGSLPTAILAGIQGQLFG